MVQIVCVCVLPMLKTTPLPSPLPPERSGAHKHTFTKIYIVVDCTRFVVENDVCFAYWKRHVTKTNNTENATLSTIYGQIDGKSNG